MATNPYVNKVVYGGTTIMDLTSDTVSVSTLARGYTAHDSSGEQVTGTAIVLDVSPYFSGTTTVLPSALTEFSDSTTIIES